MARRNLDWLIGVIDDFLAKGEGWGKKAALNREAVDSMHTRSQTESPESILKRRILENELQRQEDEMWGGGYEGFKNRMTGDMRSSSPRIREAEDLYEKQREHPGPTGVTPNGWWQGESPFMSSWRSVLGTPGQYAGPSVSEMQSSGGGSDNSWMLQDLLGGMSPDQLAQLAEQYPSLNLQGGDELWWPESPGAASRGTRRVVGSSVRLRR